MKLFTTMMLLGALSFGDDTVRATEYKSRLETKMWPYTKEENDQLN